MSSKMHRACNSCQLCCKLLPMSGSHAAKGTRAALAMIDAGLAHARDFRDMTAEFDKPAGCKCPHQKHGKGCAIYARRPFGCRTWNCRWLANDAGDLPRPDRSHYVIDIVPDFVRVVNNETGAETSLPVVQIWVDPDYPLAHRDPKLRAYVERLANEQGMAALIRYDERRGFTLLAPIFCDDRQWHEGGANELHEPQHTTEDFVRAVGGLKVVLSSE